MKILITGASGYLGRRLVLRATRDHTVLAGYARRPDRIPVGEPVLFDLLHPEEAGAVIRHLRPDAILHTAAINPGGPEDLMMKINGNGTRVVAEAAAEIGARLVHVSTDVVHNGQNAPYGDGDEPSPLGAYPHSKVAAERAVLEAHPSSALVRTSLIYGLDEQDSGTRGFIGRLAAGKPLRLFADVLRQPVWVETLAEALVRLAVNDAPGFFNVAGSQVLSREGFGRRMLAFWGHTNAARIESIRARELGLEVAYDLRLRLDRASETLEMAFPGVDEVVQGTIFAPEAL